MKITAIKQQVKRADRYSVYGDGKYKFSLSEAELLNTGLRLGQEVTPEEMDQLLERAVIDKGYDRALNLISHRPRSRWELAEYLRRKDYSPAHSEKILNKLSDRGYINDEEFAKRWVANRRLLKATSRRRLSMELRQKRIDDETINSVLAADETDEAAVLRELILRKRQQSKYQDELKLMQFLARQGFGYDAIKQALADVKEQPA